MAWTQFAAHISMRVTGVRTTFCSSSDARQKMVDFETYSFLSSLLFIPRSWSNLIVFPFFACQTRRNFFKSRGDKGKWHTAITLSLPICQSTWVVKGQIISECLFGVFNSFKRTNKNTSHSSKTNSFIRFLEEFTDWQFAFEINWPLETSVRKILAYS